MSKSASVTKRGEAGKKSKYDQGKPSEITYEWEYAKPKEIPRTNSEKIRRYLHNPEDGSYFGRTPIMWIKLLLFYTVFYIILAILFTICMYGLMLSISKDQPTYLLQDSIIGTNPGLGFRPMPTEAGLGNTVIFAKPADKNNTDFWVGRIDEFLEEYRSPPAKKGARQVCDYDSPPLGDKVCDVTLDTPEWGLCTSAHQYGFSTSSPCVFIKLNRIYDWVPDYYNNTAALPEEMPEDLKNYIKKIKDKNMLNTAWLSCNGESPADKENLGPMEMYPQPGFPGYYYPFRNQKGYLSPLVAVHFRRPAMNILIAVECRIWTKQTFFARNVHRGGEGLVHFELMLD